MRGIWAILTSIFLALYSQTASGDNLSFRQISTQDGLSQNTVRAILADQQGFIWAGTVDGLNRYDGNNFIVFKPRLDSPTPLTENRIRDLHEDRDGFIWARMYDNSFMCYDPRTERFLQIYHQDQPLSLNYTEYYESPTGSIWLSGNTGCVRLDKDNGEIKVSFLSNPQDPQLSSHPVLFLREDSQGYIWIGTVNGLNRITPDSKIEVFLEETSERFVRAVEIDGFIYFACSSGKIFLYDKQAAAFSPIESPVRNLSYAQKLDNERILILTQSHEIWLYEIRENRFIKDPFRTIPSAGYRNRVITDSKGGVWYFNHSGKLWYCNPPGGGSRRLDLIPSHILAVIDEERYTIFIDSRDNYWITTYGNGLFRYDPENDRLENYAYQDKTNSLTCDYLHAITEDASGNIWVGTEYAGMVKITPQKQEITAIYPENHYSVGSSNNVRAIFEDQHEHVWIGTKNGSLYFYDKSLSYGFCVRENLNPYTIRQDTVGNIWIGTKRNGLVVYDPEKDEIIHHFHKHSHPDSLCHQDVFNLLTDRSGRIWAATFGGGLCLAIKEDGEIKFRRFFNGSGNRSRIRYLYEDSRGNIWCGTYAGLIRFDPEELLNDPKAFEVAQFDPQNPDGLNCNDIKTIFETAGREIWVGTAGGGLNKLIDYSEGRFRFKHYTSQDGLPGDMVTAMMESPDSTLWISTESGLAQYIPRNEHFILHRLSENTFENFYNENACFLRRNGNMLWGTLNGVIGFDPKGFVKNSFSPKVTLTDFYLFDERAETGSNDSPLSRSISFTDRVRLKHNQNALTIGFALLNLTDPEMNRYSYILEPYDKAWSRPANTSTATYKNLSPGRYVFSVRGANADGEWSDQTTRLEIRVLPPFWKTGWAYGIYTVLLLIILYIAYRLIYKFNHLNNAVRMEKQLTNYKLRFFTNISHEFRTPLTLISGVTENLLVTQDKLPPEARNQLRLLDRNTQQMRRLIDQLLEFRKIQNTNLTLNLEKVDLEKFVWEIYTAFRETAKQKTIDYRFSCLLTESSVYIDREKVEKIVFNLLSNAFKFTPNDGTIEIVISESIANRTFKITVKDSGCGIPKEKQHLLFSRFMQLHFSAGGTGVGLSLVKEMVETHKGTIRYEENEHQGSVFHVEIPATADAYSKENFVVSRKLVNQDEEIVVPDDHLPLELPELEPAVLTDWKILVIDDNPDILDFLYGELSKYFKVDTASNGKIGLEKAMATDPNLLICDIMMPEMDGFQMTRMLKEEFQTSHIPIILLTVHSSMEHQLEGVQSGADFYITKPFSLKYLLSKIYKLIEQHEKLKKRYSGESVEPEKLLSETEQDQKFYRKINDILEQNLSSPQFTVEEFTELSGLKRTVFYKKVKGLTGFTPNELIKIKRMKRAAELLQTGEFSVSEVSWKVGIEDQFYFSKIFKAQFGCSPSRYKSGDPHA